MSADNGIYILETEGPEFRVAHLQAVDNLEWDDETSSPSDNPDVWIKNAREMWRASAVYSNADDAYRRARDLLKKHEWTEYGICEIRIGRKF